MPFAGFAEPTVKITWITRNAAKIKPTQRTIDATSEATLPPVWRQSTAARRETRVSSDDDSACSPMPAVSHGVPPIATHK
ncbi:hypothetical protein GCM10017567_43200 [Amycolatopsis bullii]|uniref:Uncharacterized protein n=1 Tax=Amycolatopsis bullii TaxID=941987 RepID=A0ABQ3KFW5_9PSEU|nr:hypothetical protein GCM10017567_43200 [Amycolatopsis bullii]